MNGLLMAGAIASAFAAMVGAGLIVVKAFVKAVEAIVRPEFDALREQHILLSSKFKTSQSEQDEEWYGELKMVRERMTDFADHVYWLQSELKPNHGSSLRDAIDRIEKRLEQHIAHRDA
jgi:predicted thioredoxin/glutaredoxin